MKRTLLLAVLAVGLIAVLAVVVNLPRIQFLPNREAETPPVTPVISPSPSPTPSGEPIDVAPYEARIRDLTDQNEALRQALYKATRFVSIEELSDSIIIDLRYATEDNITGKALYPVTICLLREETAQKLLAAEARLAELGYRIKIWDAYRPLSAQRPLYDAVEDKRFIANPQNGSRHNRGAAVDLTLTDLVGNEVEMPSGFDEFARAGRDNPDMSETAREHLALLTEVMTECGFTTMNSEWWHYDDSDWKNYPIQDIGLEAFAK